MHFIYSQCSVPYDLQVVCRTCRPIKELILEHDAGFVKASPPEAYFLVGNQLDRKGTES